MGFNIMTHCIVFLSLRKHDCRSLRELLLSKCMQMTGRAGRYGLNNTSVVIINATNEAPDTPTLHTMQLDSAAKLESQFRFTYNMILNLLRTKQLCMKAAIKRSFGENTLRGQVPKFEHQVVDIKKRLIEILELSCLICEEDISGCYHTAMAMQKLASRLHSTVAYNLSGTGTTGYIAQAFCTWPSGGHLRVPKARTGHCIHAASI
ncbi:Antiviral helicase ski2 [Linderina macrospora]|uniref:Antiviral helicase ski2 n=1 Tax=Linderina macrospora TaxID=4868 RepID=A0ACC1JFS0_9FUNG|nr:Antiviral helicase ski2 [Linderina macrospora]